MGKIVSRLKATPKEITLYIILFLATGFAMNALGKKLQIAWFANWWQVVTCYGVYLIPCALFIRNLSFFQQYLHGLFFLALLEFPAYAIGSSVIAENNYIDIVFSRANFTLFMVIFFAAYLPLANRFIRLITTTK